MQKITNWSQYNKSLQNRGSVTLWFSDEAIKAWTNWKRPSTSKEGGRPGTYGDAAIRCALTIRAVFHLPLRQTRGFIKDLFVNAGIFCHDLETTRHIDGEFRTVR